jgi:uncharacterized protein (TIGR00266 family)
MKYTVTKEPMAMLEIELARDEQITAEAGSMVYMKGDIEIKTRTQKGGFFKKLSISALGQETFFVNDYIAHGDTCILGLTGPQLGDIWRMVANPGTGFMIQSGSYICSTPDIQLDTEWQGFKKGLFGTGLFMIKVSGVGDVFLNAYGGIIQKELLAGEKIIIDNYHLVAFSENMSYRVTKFGGLKTTILGGEGLVTEITGPGTAYFQTKNLRQLALALSRYLPKSSSSSVSFGS